MSKFIIILHLIMIGIMVDSMIPARIINEITAMGTIFFIGCLALNNTIHRMFHERE